MRGSIINDRATISVLPNELLGAIFELGHSSQELDDCHFEILVSSVSRHWRDVALRTPRLWNIISRRFEQRLERIAVYLNRSKSVPIHLRISIGGLHADYQEDIAIGGLCQLLNSHFCRCHHLAIHSRCPKRLVMLLHNLHSVSAPFLRRIDISCPERCFDDEGGDSILPAWGQIFVGGTPSLTSISMKNIGLQCCLPPLGSVTAIYLCCGSPYSTGITSDEWVKMLSSAPSLLHLEIDGDLEVEFWSPSMAFEMPQLQRLSISANDNGKSSFHGFLGCIKAPRLEVLLLKYFTVEETGGVRPNPFPSLHTLILQNIFLDQDQSLEDLGSLDNLLAAFPDIQHLVCTIQEADEFESAIYNDLLSLLTPRHGARHIFMPRLRTIALPVARDVTPWADVRDMLVARRSIDQPIHKLFVGPPTQLPQVSAVFPLTEGIVRVETWKSERVLGWPAWTNLP